MLRSISKLRAFSKVANTQLLSKGSIFKSNKGSNSSFAEIKHNNLLLRSSTDFTLPVCNNDNKDQNLQKLTNNVLKDSQFLDIAEKKDLYFPSQKSWKDEKISFHCNEDLDWFKRTNVCQVGYGFGKPLPPPISLVNFLKKSYSNQNNNSSENEKSEKSDSSENGKSEKSDLSEKEKSEKSDSSENGNQNNSSSKQGNNSDENLNKWKIRNILFRAALDTLRFGLFGFGVWIFLKGSHATVEFHSNEGIPTITVKVNAKAKETTVEPLNVVELLKDVKIETSHKHEVTFPSEITDPSLKEVKRLLRNSETISSKTQLSDNKS